MATDEPDIVATLNGHRAEVRHVAYLPGGMLLASAGADGETKLWDVSGRRGEEPPLYRYLEDDWCSVSLEKIEWQAGGGFLNVPEGSIIDLWQRSAGARDEQLVARLTEAENWAGAVSIARPGNLQEPLGGALLADAEKSAALNRWYGVQLRLRQLKNLGAGDIGRARAAALQARIPGTTGANFTNGEGIELIWCPAGQFTMGSPEEHPQHRESENQHEVTFSSGFWIGKYELSQAQYNAIMGVNTDHQSAPENSSDQIKRTWKEIAPAETMDWPAAMEYCRKLTELERARGAVPPGWEYSLPTEAQWEYACRAGTSTAYYFGDDPSQLHRYGNFDDINGGFKEPDLTQDDGYKFSAPRGSYLPNKWDLYDMHGNVWEWCRDAMASEDQEKEKPMYAEGPVTDPLVQKGLWRVYRGGGFSSKAAHFRCAYRRRNNPADSDTDLGMRPVLTRVRTDAAP